MIIVSYDISDDKLRHKFSEFLKKFGHRIQYSTFEIKNSKRLLNIVMSEIKNNYENSFDDSDSVIIIETSENCKITKCGYAKNDDSDIIVVS